MWPFNKKKADLAEVFRGYTDWHCHILPGVDDGVQTMEDALAILAQYKAWGVCDVWLTPHIMEDIPNTTSHLRERFEELKAAYAADREARLADAQGSGSGANEGPLPSKTPEKLGQGSKKWSATPTEAVTLHLAAENMMDNLFDERLAAGDLLPIGPKGDHLLVETSYFSPPMDLWGTLARIREAGYKPILAHPERYVYMTDSDYERLKAKGVLFQMNLFSQAGAYGKTAQKKVRDFRSKHWYDISGTDLHRAAFLTHKWPGPIYPL